MDSSEEKKPDEKGASLATNQSGGSNLNFPMLPPVDHSDGKGLSEEVNDYVDGLTDVASGTGINLDGSNSCPCSCDPEATIENAASGMSQIFNDMKMFDAGDFAFKWD